MVIYGWARAQDLRVSMAFDALPSTTAARRDWTAAWFSNSLRTAKPIFGSEPRAQGSCWSKMAKLPGSTLEEEVLRDVWWQPVKIPPAPFGCPWRMDNCIGIGMGSQRSCV